MKRFCSLAIVVLALQASVFAQCPDTTIIGDGFHPVSDSLDCVERGLVFNEFIQANIPATITTPLGAVTVTSIVINDIQGMPSGITHTCAPSNCTFTGPSTGCINFSGTTNDPAGVYRLTFTVTVSVNTALGPFNFGPDNLDSLIAQLPFQLPLLSGIQYSLNVIEQGGACPPVLPVEVSVSAAPASLCTGESSTLTAVVTNGSGAETFAWSGSASTSDTSQVSPNITSTYTVTVTDNGQTATATVTVTVSDPPVADFELSDSLMPTITFTNNSQFATSYSWDFDDGSTGVDFEPTHEYLANGDYTITLTATNSCGSDTDTDSVTITGVYIKSVENNLEFSVSPNPSEGVFTIRFADNSGKPATVKIYDLSGKNVFEETFSGIVERQMNLTSLPKGVYSLHISSDESNGVQRLVIR